MNRLDRIEDVYEELMAWLGKNDWSEDLNDYGNEFWQYFPEVSGGPTISEALTRLPPQDVDFANLITLENFLVEDFENDLTPYQAFLDDTQAEVAPEVDAFFRSLQGSVMSVYLVDEVKEDYVLVSDVFRGGESVRVEEAHQTEWLREGDRIAVRVLDVNGTPRFSRAIVPLTPEMWKLTEQGAKDVEREAKEKGLASDEFLRSIPDFTACLLFVDRYYEVNGGAEEPVNEGTMVTLLRYPLNTSEKHIANKLNSAADFERNDEGAEWVYNPGKLDAQMPTVLMIRDGEFMAIAPDKQAGKELTKRLNKIFGDGIGRPATLEVNANMLMDTEDEENDEEA